MTKFAWIEKAIAFMTLQYDDDNYYKCVITACSTGKGLMAKAQNIVFD